MNQAFPILMLSLVLLGGCNIALPNGVFSCGSDGDCPGGLYCWSTSRCNDTEEPDCTPRSCEQVIADFAAVGISVECGTFDDGCGGMTEECGSCPPGEACGAGGENAVTCGCDEITCNAVVEGGAECGIVESACGGDPIRCGPDDCPGLEVCESNRCVCPAGVDCEAACGGCKDNEYCDPDSGLCICDPIDACTLLACTQQGIPDGCGGITSCPCPGGQECDNVNGDFKCLDACACDLNDVECGVFACGGGTEFCGNCFDAGYQFPYSCRNNKCSCQDDYEPNNGANQAALICGPGTAANCSGDNWNVSVSATFEQESSPADDWYRLRVADSFTPIDVSIRLVDSAVVRASVYASYLCSNGSQGIVDCTDELIEIEDVPGVPDGTTACGAADGDMTLFRNCGGLGGPDASGMLFIVVQPLESHVCEPYDLGVAASGQIIVPPL